MAHAASNGDDALEDAGGRPLMLSTHLGPSADLPPWAVGLACVLAIFSLALLLVEMRDAGGSGGEPSSLCPGSSRSRH